MQVGFKVIQRFYLKLIDKFVCKIYLKTNNFNQTKASLDLIRKENFSSKACF